MKGPGEHPGNGRTGLRREEGDLQSRNCAVRKSVTDIPLAVPEFPGLTTSRRFAGTPPR